MKPLPKLPQRIFAIALQCVVLVGRKLHRTHLDTTSPISLIQKFPSVLSVPFRRRLHELNRCPVRIAHIDDALPTIRSGL